MGGSVAYLCKLDITEAKCEKRYINENVPFALCTAGCLQKGDGRTFTKDCGYRFCLTVELPETVGDGKLSVAEAAKVGVVVASPAVLVTSGG
jgi:hypothetical protein